MIDPSTLLCPMFDLHCPRCPLLHVNRLHFPEFSLPEDGNSLHFQCNPVAYLFLFNVPDTNTTSEIVSTVSPIDCFE